MSVTAFRGPGVIVESSTRAGAASSAGANTGRYFLVGLFAQGPTEPTLIRSTAELTQRFGERPAYSAAWDSLATFFAEGGSQAYVLRLVGPSATTGTLTLKDTAGANTLRIDALGAGDWSTAVTVEVAAGSTTDTIKITVRDGQAIEVYDNIATVGDAVNKLSVSKYVRAADLGSTTTAPGNLPATQAATALSAGTDDRAAITATQATQALDQFSGALGTGAVAMPGYTADLVGPALRAHAKATRRIAILAPKIGATGDEMKALAQSLISADGSYTMLAYPWVRISIAPGVTNLVSPEGYVAAARARAHTAVGPWAAAAGPASAARSLVGLEREVGQSEGSELNEAGVSVIRTVGTAIMLYGYRSLAIDAVNYRLVAAQDTMNYLAQRCETALEPFVFSPMNDGILGQVDGILRGVCHDIRTAGGLYAWYTDTAPRQEIDPGYSVDASNALNTRETMAQGILQAQVAVRLAEQAELIRLSLIRVAMTAAV